MKRHCIPRNEGRTPERNWIKCRRVFDRLPVPPPHHVYETQGTFHIPPGPWKDLMATRPQMHLECSASVAAPHPSCHPLHMCVLRIHFHFHGTRNGDSEGIGIGICSVAHTCCLLVLSATDCLAWLRQHLSASCRRGAFAWPSFPSHFYELSVFVAQPKLLGIHSHCGGFTLVFTCLMILILWP